MPKRKNTPLKSKATNSSRNTTAKETKAAKVYDISERIQAKTHETVGKDTPKLKELRVEKVREWLTINKVFFETVAATFLTIMAIILAWGQLKVAQKQTEYLERQTIIQNAQASPQFVVELDYVRDAATNFSAGDRISIYNQGILAREVKVDTVVLIKLVTVKNSEMPEKIIPLTGYFWITSCCNNTGLIATIEGTNNFAKWVSIEQSFREITDQNNVIINVSLQRYVRITYRDIFDTYHADHYFVPGTGSPDLLNTPEGEAIFEQYDIRNVVDTALDLDKMTAQDLYNLAP